MGKREECGNGWVFTTKARLYPTLSYVQIPATVRDLLELENGDIVDVAITKERNILKEGVLLERDKTVEILKQTKEWYWYILNEAPEECRKALNLDAMLKDLDQVQNLLEKIERDE